MFRVRKTPPNRVFIVQAFKDDDLCMNGCAVLAVCSTLPTAEAEALRYARLRNSELEEDGEVGTPIRLEPDSKYGARDDSWTTTANIWCGDHLVGVIFSYELKS